MRQDPAMSAPTHDPSEPKRGDHAPNEPRPRPSPEDLERRYAHALRVFAQTAVVSAVVGGICLLINTHTTRRMALFILSWAAGWACATIYLFVRKVVQSVHRRGNR